MSISAYDPPAQVDIRICANRVPQAPSSALAEKGIGGSDQASVHSLGQTAASG
jgi:hypothetical protein